MEQLEPYLVYMTLPSTEDAPGFAEKLVGAGLCAGINILGPAISVYHWQGEMRKAAEWILFAQVGRRGVEKFINAALAMHPYLVPCILGLPACAGHVPFMKWIENPLLDGRG